MSHVEDYVDLKLAIAQNEQETNSFYNAFLKSIGELRNSISLNSKLTDKEKLILALDVIQEASKLIERFRTDTSNNNILLKFLDETSGDTLKFMKEQESIVEKSKDGRASGTKKTQANSELWLKYIIECVSDYCKNNQNISTVDLEHEVKRKLQKARNSGVIVFSSGDRCEAPANPPIEGAKGKIKLAFKELNIESPYPARPKKR